MRDRTVRNLIDAGNLPAYRVGRVIKVRPEDLERYLWRPCGCRKLIWAGQGSDGRGSPALDRVLVGESLSVRYFRLSRREGEVLRLLAEGQSTQHIAEALLISRNTVWAHVQRVITKLGSNSKLEAVAVARRVGLF